MSTVLSAYSIEGLSPSVYKVKKVWSQVPALNSLMQSLPSGGATASSFASICCGQVPFFTNWWNTASVLWFLFNQNIRKYLLTEAREKNRPEFLQGWQTAVTKCIPQQKNDSDCGVFVLQYCKCLALEQPFQFSQEDMPRVRKRIYKELCECRLMDWISRDSGKSDQVGAGGLLLESPLIWIFTGISDQWCWATIVTSSLFSALNSFL